MNILSLFDGLSCAQIALNRAGIKYDNYFASEVDKYAIQVCKDNYPNTIHLGDVTRHIDWELPKIDLLVGGSPCQGFSIAGKQLNFDDSRSALFFKYLEVLKFRKPKYFLLENVASMKSEIRDEISRLMGVQPILINSALVSAQNRKRYYWTNLPYDFPPEDKGIMLEDVLENSENSAYQYPRGKNKGGEIKGKSPTMTSNSWEHNVKVPVIKNRGELIYKPHKSQCLDANYFKGADNHGQRTGVIHFGKNYVQWDTNNKGNKSQDQRAYYKNGKHGALPSHGAASKVKVLIDTKRWRKLTLVECERLQTIPDNFTASVSNSQRYKMIGNSFTADVIAHILKGIIK